MTDLDLGNGYTLTFTSWAPDRELNPQYADYPDIEKAGAIIRCPHGYESAIIFKHDVPGFEEGWTVESWEPLTLSPSLASRSHECHGFIREGKWESA